MPDSPPNRVGNTRDLRIDFLRGLALWVIFADHIHNNFWRNLTYRNFGLSDAAEVFVFLSGLACAISYGRTLRSRGFAAAQYRSLKRAAQIYLGYLLASLAFFAIALSLRPQLRPEAVEVLDLAPLLTDPWRAAAAALDFLYTPYILMVLPLYAVLVPLAPPLLQGIRRRPTLTLGLSFALWLAVQFQPSLNLPSLLESGAWPLDPFAWQFIFTLGLMAGWRQYHLGWQFSPLPWQVWGACLVVAAGLALRLLHAASFHFGWNLPALDTLYNWALSEGSKTRLSLTRLVHFLSVALLAGMALRGRETVFRSPLARPLTICGQHALPIFCVSIVLDLLASIWVVASVPSRAAQLVVTIAGWVLLWLCAAMLVRREIPMLVPSPRARPEASQQ